MQVHHVAEVISVNRKGDGQPLDGTEKSHEMNFKACLKCLGIRDKSKVCSGKVVPQFFKVRSNEKAS